MIGSDLSYALITVKLGEAGVGKVSEDELGRARICARRQARMSIDQQEQP